MHLHFWQALLLGILQGFSELFPVSSLGHTIIVKAALHWHFSRSNHRFLAFVVALHLATATALVIYFWKEWKVVLLAYLGSLKRRKLIYNDASKFAWLLVAGTIIVGAVGLALEKHLRILFDNPGFVWLVGVFLIVNGVVMVAGDYLKRRALQETGEAGPRENVPASSTNNPAAAAPSESSAAATTGGRSPLAGDPGGNAPVKSQRKRTEDLTLIQGGMVGSAQTFALLPGISRSGVTIVAGILAGLTYEEACRFAFMLATPVIGAAALLKVPALFKSHAHGHGHSILAITLVAAIAAGITAYFSIKFLMKYFETRKLWPFAIYCMVLGALVVAFLRVPANGAGSTRAHTPAAHTGGAAVRLPAKRAAARRAVL